MESNYQSSIPDAPDQETMDAIRQRRIEKIGALGGSSAKPQPSGSPSASTQQPAPPSSDVEPRAAERKRAAASDEPGLSDQKAVATGSETARRPPRKQTPPRSREESMAEWQDRQLMQIFRLTVDPEKQEVLDLKVTFLEGLHQELQQNSAPLLLSVDLLDSAVPEGGALLPASRHLLDYLLPCWKRVTKILKTFQPEGDQGTTKLGLLKEARRICFSNCIFALTMPELFGREPSSKDTLAPFLFRPLDDELGICLDFYNEAVSRISEDESIAPLFVKAMDRMSKELSTKSMIDDYKPYMSALTTYSKFPVLLDALAQDASFQMAVSAPAIERHTLLGPFFRISPIVGNVAQDYFPSPRILDTARVKNTQAALRATLDAHQQDLAAITNAFVRASAKARNRILDWFAYIMNANHKSRAIQVDPKEVASDGFMLNVAVILSVLCEPFMDATFAKVDRIDIDYLRRSPRLDVKDETKLNADQAQSDGFYATDAKGTSNFISEVFFLALAAHHYGSGAVAIKWRNLEKDIKFFEKQIAVMEAERLKLLSRPDQLRLIDASMSRHISVLEKSISKKFALQGALLDEKMQSRSLQFMRYVSVWLLCAASQTLYRPDKPLSLPLSSGQPEAFSCLPEYALQNVVDHFQFVLRHMPQIVISAVGDEIIALCLTFLESSEYIRNPYQKSSLVTLLFSGTWPIYHRTRGVLADLMTNTDFANKYLLHAVMKFYIECESTGAHTQFYDKFNIRYEIFQVIKCVWVNDHYRHQLTQSSKTNRAFFVRFVNLLMNDATYVLDEGLSRLPKIRELQSELHTNTALAPPERQKKEEELKAAEGQAQSYIQLANETVSMMKLFTDALSEAFTMPEVVTRLAGMLDYNLDILVGPKSKKLLVENMDKYHFNPKTLMPEIVDIYLNLGSSRAFVDAVASDGRSYKTETFEAASRILKGKQLKSQEELQAWEDLCQRFAKAKETLDQAELDFGDVPAEFEDPIMGDLMKDPVILPSQHVVDRGTIIQHLLSDQKDPFTRQPMTVDDVVPDTDLRAKIEKWKEVKMREARAKMSDPMDLSY